MPSFGVGGATMRDAVTFYNGSIRAFPAITDFARTLSTVLGRHPEVRGVLFDLPHVIGEAPSLLAARGVQPGGFIWVHGITAGLGWVGKLHRLRDWTVVDVDFEIVMQDDESPGLWRRR